MFHHIWEWITTSICQRKLNSKVHEDFLREKLIQPFVVLVDAQTLRGELDLHKYSTVDRAKIRVDMIAEKKVMTQADFTEMDGIIRT